ncbi:MAG TPA: dihydrodipicolinate synthase family protein [Acidimicrobiia bacterium]|jgi:4-hydroxy-tetrahydrodipicolinate synthase|nr:dihydrodipicolinate synthase family protein [Acidimicrobiia bacterium]
MTALSPAKQTAFEKVKGLWIAIPTPFTATGEIDEGNLRKTVDYYIEGLAVDGIFCGGVMGEFWSMTVEERARVHELVVGTAAGRVPVMAHIGHHTYSEAARLSQHAEQIGADFVIAVNPYFPIKPSDDIVRDWYRRLTSESSVPFFLFNTSYSGYPLSPELISELADLETVCGIKNPKPMEHLLKVKELAGDRIVVCDADESDWLGLHLDHGFQSLMSTPALAMYQTPDYRPILDYTRMADMGKTDDAWALQVSLERERAAFQRWMRDQWLARGEGAIPIAELKTWLGLMGLPQGPVRPPLIPLSEERVDALRADLDALGLLESVA